MYCMRWLNQSSVYELLVMSGCGVGHDRNPSATSVSVCLERGFQKKEVAVELISCTFVNLLGSCLRADNRKVINARIPDNNDFTAAKMANTHVQK